MAMFVRGGRRRAAVLAAAAAVLAVGPVACADDGSGDSGGDAGGGAAGDTPAVTDKPGVEPLDLDPSLRTMEQAAEASARGPYLIELSMTLDGDEPVPVMTGEVDDTGSEISYDYGAALEVLAGGRRPPGLGAHDLTIETVADLPIIYMRMPGFIDLARQNGEAPELAELGDRWGRIDTEALPRDSSSDIVASFVGQGTDLAAYLDLLWEAEGDVEPLGTAEVRDEPAAGLAAEVPLVDVLQMSGISRVRAQQRSDIDVLRTHVPLEVWISADGEVRRISYRTDLATASAARGEDPESLGDLAESEITYTVDLWDDGSFIRIEPPAESVDITDAMARELESQD